MSDESTSEITASANRWAIELSVAAIVVAVATGALFYFTTRGIFDRPADSQTPRNDPRSSVVSLEHGLAVYASNCATCHGPAGLGDGPSAAQLNPKPRDFSTGSFKIGDTRSGLPSDQGLVASIRRGLFPNMPPWPQLSEGEVKSAAMAVRHLAIEGQVTGRLSRDPKSSRDAALKSAHARLDSGPMIVLPSKPAEIDLARGKLFYINKCAPCHDPDGRGRLRDDLVDSNEQPLAARDLTTGIFKGGNDVEDIAMRIVRGIPGSPMPAPVTISGDDLWATAVYVRSLREPQIAPTKTDSTPVDKRDERTSLSR